MGTSISIVVSSSNYPNNTNSNPASSSIGAFTGSMLGGSGVTSIVVSSSNFVGTLASSSIAPITGSMIFGAAGGINTSLFYFVSSSTTVVSGGGGSAFYPTTYVMTGFYLATLTRETWSGASINTPPPSGHALVDVTIVGLYNPMQPTNF